MSAEVPPPSMSLSPSPPSSLLPCPPPLPPSTLVGGSPCQVAMRAQAVLPAFPPLPTPLQSTHSPSTPSLSFAPLEIPPQSLQWMAESSGGPMAATPPLPPPSPSSASSATTAAPLSPTQSPPPRPLHVAPLSGTFASASSQSALEWSGRPTSPSSSSSAVRRVDENVKVSKAMIAFLLEALQTTMFTKKKDALDTYATYFQSSHPRYTRADALLLFYGSPITPQSTLSTFHSTSSFTRIDRGLLAAAGQLSWKNGQLRASSGKALGLVALLLDPRHNADAAVFHALMAEADYAVVKLMRLPKHLSSPSPSSSAVGNLHAALRVIDLVRDLRPDLIEQLLAEKDVHAQHLAGGGGAAKTAPPLHTPSLSPPSGPPPLPVHSHLLQVATSHAVSGGGDSGASTPKAAAEASQPHGRPSHFPPPLPPSSASASSASLQPFPSGAPPPGLRFALPPPSSSNFHTAPHPLNLTAAALEVAHMDGHLPQTGPSSSAVNSPLARPKKGPAQFGSLQSGLHIPRAQTASPGPGGAGVDDWKQRLRAHLSGFFQTRVSREELESKGVLKAARVFGVSLEALAAVEDVEDSGGVPRLLHRCIGRLSSPAELALPGLFRISGDSREVGELKAKFDVGEAVALGDYSPHSVSGLMKLWLRELPEPLLTYALYKPLIDAFRGLQAQGGGHVVDTAPLLSLLEGLPSAHHRALQPLLHFLALVSGQSSVNLMTSHNLAICFAPNLLRPRVETLESVARDTPIAIGVIKALVDHTAHSTQQQQQPTLPRSSLPHLPLPRPAPSLSPLLSLPPSPRGEGPPAIPSPTRPPPLPPSTGGSSNSRSPSPSPPFTFSSTPPPLPPPLPLSPSQRPTSPSSELWKGLELREESKVQEMQPSDAERSVRPLPH